MRALMTAGPALRRDNIAGYNCSYVAVNRLRAFDEILYILMCGTGVGFSVEKNEIFRENFRVDQKNWNFVFFQDFFHHFSF